MGTATAAKIVANDAKGVAGPEHLKEEKPLRPSQCREYMRRQLAREFPSIVDGFVQGAKSGSCQHVKLAAELLNTRPRAKRAPSGGSTLRRLVQKIDQIQD